ncbi:hypothetical protein DP923_01040 [Pontibacter arcticus]|uniref:Uncharacterized protein n=1 Tax=Pontibacter arcticus TaxID=2080288 RepID=A0A364RJL7_9BACT|nr:hypothetical protein DP923_01040 [Pontibacter arcticus]
MSACTTSKKKPERVIVISKKNNVIKKDNGNHKGWYKNPNNPHHLHTTNPGHTKHKGKGMPGKGNNGKGKKH